MARLPQRPLGKSGINTAAIGLGCMSFSGVYGPSEEPPPSRSFTRR